MKTQREKITHIMDFFYTIVSLSGQANVGGMGVDDDQDRVAAVSLYQVVDGNVVLAQLGSSVVPTHNFLTGIDLTATEEVTSSCY